MAFADHPTLHPLNLRRSLEAHVPRKFFRDWMNRALYGPDAPLSDECVYPIPREVNEGFDNKRAGFRLRRAKSGVVMGGNWDRFRSNVEDVLKIRSCRLHYEQGVPWDQTPLFEDLLRRIAEGRPQDDLYSREDIVARYEALDRVFDETQRRGRLLTKAELPDYFRREHGGILVHIDRDGKALRSGGGMHRFAIARILDLPEMPAQLGVVHAQAVMQGLLAPLRQSRFGPASRR